MDTTFNLISLFDIIENNDLKRFEFNSRTNLLTSYTVSYTECDNIDDAKISVYKAIKKDVEGRRSLSKLMDFYYSNQPQKAS